MASKCFYLNVFYTFFIFYSFTVETFSESDEHYVAYTIDDADFSTHNIHISSLERRVRQAGTPPEKKYEAPSAEKPKVTKKPTALDAKPSIPNPDGDDKQKPKTVTKKEPILIKTVTNNQTTDVHDGEHPAIHGEQHEDAPDTSHPQSNHSSIMENAQTNVTLVNVTTESPVKKSTTPEAMTNLTVPDSEIQANKFLDADLNATLEEHHINTQKEDYHLYYNSSMLHNSDAFQRYWVDFDKVKDVKNILSNSHRRAVTVKLSFDFPFYGHLIRKIIIATGGFLYTGEYVHSWLSVTQYIAPLMANFDTATSNHSSIKYIDNGTAFTVQWENVVLQDKPDEGNFTFQCTLFKNGDIVFVYKHISVAIDNTTNSQHPIKVGLSDAYIIDRTIFLVRRKTIYEYHRVKFGRDRIRNETVILLNALETCLGLKDCHSCVTEIPNFECNWCSNRCSNGMDRNRQDWLSKGCNDKKRLTAEECLAEDMPLSIIQSQASSAQSSDSNANMGIGLAGIMGILFVICFALGIGVWLFYAYRNPHSPAGQFLIRYRPSQWSWKRGEARYTAATIHM